VTQSPAADEHQLMTVYHGDELVLPANERLPSFAVVPSREVPSSPHAPRRPDDGGRLSEDKQVTEPAATAYRIISAINPRINRLRPAHAHTRQLQPVYTVATAVALRPLAPGRASPWGALDSLGSDRCARACWAAGCCRYSLVR